MRNNWLGTAAIALVIGTGSAFAQQSDLPQKRDEAGSRTSVPSKGAERPAAHEQRSPGVSNDRAAQREPGAAAEPRRGEMTPQREQAQEQQLRGRQPTRQSEGQMGRERPTVGEAPQLQDQRSGRDHEQATEQKRPQGREDRQKLDQRTLDTGAESRPQSRQQPRRGEPQTTGANQQNQQKNQQKESGADRAAEQKQPPGRERNDQAAQPPSAASQTGRQPEMTGEARQRETTGQANNQSNQRTSMVNDQQRTQVIDRLQRERDSWRDTENINIRVNVGERLPERVRPRPLPPDIVTIAPQYRDYEYTMIQDEIVIVDPRSRDVVDVIDEPGRSAGGYYRSRTRVSLSSEQRDLLRREALSAGSTTVGSTAAGGGSGQTCLTLRPVPQDLARNNPDLANLSYVAVGDQVVLVDPRERRVVDVIDQDR